MYRATTPIHTFSLPISTDDCKDIQVTYKQGKNVILEKYMDDRVLPSGMTLHDKDVVVTLTQEETKLFGAKKATVQIRILTDGGTASASDIFDITVKDVLHDNELT